MSLFSLTFSNTATMTLEGKLEDFSVVIAVVQPLKQSLAVHVVVVYNLSTFGLEEDSPRQNVDQRVRVTFSSNAVEAFRSQDNTILHLIIQHHATLYCRSSKASSPFGRTTSGQECRSQTGTALLCDCCGHLYSQY